MSVYYNEFDPFAAEWLRELIKDGLIPEGMVDTRSIVDVRAEELAGYRQCHFFAGIGGWARALDIAGFGDYPCWTGSCPCQPFSAIGKGAGTDDARHLWPAFRGLITQCRPPVVFGEQVASPAGRQWLSRVRADLEALGYGVGAADLCAAGVGAPHIRQRLYWVGDTERQGLEGQPWPVDRRRQSRRDDQEETGPTAAPSDVDPWKLHSVISLRDGSYRRLQAEPSLFPLADGVPNRVGLLRGAGNAIVPQVAAEFINAYMEARL